MLARLLSLLFWVGTAAAQGIPPERLFPLAIDNRWQYEVEISRKGVPFDRYYRDIEVVGDTVIGGTAWTLLRERQIDSTFTVVAEGRIAARVVVDSVAVAPLACFWCGNGVSAPLPESLKAIPIVIGGITYYPEGVGLSFRDGPVGPGWVKEYWRHATDIGLYSYLRSSDSMGSPHTESLHTLVYAVVGGAIYGDIPVASTPDPDDSGPTLLVRPNPTRGRTALDLELTAAADVRIEAFDALGRRIALKHSGPLGAGAHVIPLDLSGWSSGVYVLRVEAGHWRRTTPVIVR